MLLNQHFFISKQQTIFSSKSSVHHFCSRITRRKQNTSAGVNCTHSQANILSPHLHPWDHFTSSADPGSRKGSHINTELWFQFKMRALISLPVILQSSTLRTPTAQYYKRYATNSAELKMIILKDLEEKNCWIHTDSQSQSSSNRKHFLFLVKYWNYSVL